MTSNPKNRAPRASGFFLGPARARACCMLLARTGTHPLVELAGTFRTWDQVARVGDDGGNTRSLASGHGMMATVRLQNFLNKKRKSDGAERSCADKPLRSVDLVAAAAAGATLL